MFSLKVVCVVVMCARAVSDVSSPHFTEGQLYDELHRGTEEQRDTDIGTKSSVDSIVTSMKDDADGIVYAMNVYDSEYYEKLSFWDSIHNIANTQIEQITTEAAAGHCSQRQWV